MSCRHFLFLVPMLALGCGTENKTLSENEFVNQYAEDVCAGVVPACLVTAANCSAIQIAARGQQAQTAAQNRWTFMPDSAQVCLSKASSVFGTVKQSMVLKPADYQAFVEACDQVYRGAKKANEGCAYDADCIGGLICDKGYCGPKSVAVAGAGCANIGQTCPEGSYCGVLTGGIRSCVAKIGLGGTCDAAVPCLETLRCQSGVCVGQLATAETCSVDQDCQSGFCDPFAIRCAEDIRFAPSSPACIALGGPT